MHTVGQALSPALTRIPVPSRRHPSHPEQEGWKL